MKRRVFLFAIALFAVLIGFHAFVYEASSQGYQTYLIENYVLRYDKTNDRPWIIFHFKVDGAWKNVNWFPPKENAVYIADMLRNEKPIYWVPQAGYLTTSAEAVGEGAER